MRTHFKWHVASKDIDGRQHSGTGVSPHAFHTLMCLHKFWVANCGLASTSTTRFATVTAGLRSGLNQNWTHSKDKALLASKDMDGIMPHHFHTPMSLHKLLVARYSLALTSATHFATVAAGLRSGLSQNVDLCKGALDMAGSTVPQELCHFLSIPQ